MIFYSCYGVLSHSLEAVFLNRKLILFIYINSNRLEVEKIFFFTKFNLKTLQIIITFVYFIFYIFLRKKQLEKL